MSAAKPIDEVQTDIVAEMAGLTDVVSQYQYLIAQARALPAPPTCIRTDENVLARCQVEVWLTTGMNQGRLQLLVDTDALLVKGLAALLVRVLDNRSPAEVLGANLFFLDRTGLKTHLSPARANGLAAMLERIRDSAAANS